jgi:hypothetical protein
MDCLKTILGIGGDDDKGKDKDTGRQQASLMAHDEIEDLREAREVEELGSPLYGGGKKKAIKKTKSKVAVVAHESTP